MRGKRSFDFDKVIGKATWIPGFVAFAVFAGVIGLSAYSSLSNQISADTVATPTPSAAKIAGSDCGATLETDASGKQTSSGYIKVAVNNYWVPSGLASAAQHKAYNTKTSNSPYRCNEISVKVPNAAKCLTDSDNMKAINTAVSQKYKLGYVSSTKEFEALSGDQMKKTVIGSSIKPKCLGGSESYEGLKDDRQASDSKLIETAKGAAEGVVSGGEDVKTPTPKSNPAVAKQVAQGQEGSGGSKTTRTGAKTTTTSNNGPTNATADEPGLSGVKNALLPDIHKGEWQGGRGDNRLYKVFLDGQKASTWYSKQGNPYLSIKGKDGKYYRAPIKIDGNGNAKETGNWEPYDGKGGTRVTAKSGGKVGEKSAEHIIARKAKSEATARSVPNAQGATTGKIRTGGSGAWPYSRIVKQIPGQPYSTMVKDNSTGKYYWSMRKNGEYFRALVLVSGNGSYKTKGGYVKYTYSKRVHRQVISNDPRKVPK